MLLYHFTAWENLASIAKEGLNRGEVPLNHRDCLNAVWLTNDKRPEGHGLCDAYKLTDKDKAIFNLPKGKDFFFPNKRAIRLSVIIPRNDRNLDVWSRWGKKNLDPNWYATLDITGGGKAKSWFVYWGVIPPDWISGVWDLAKGEAVQQWQAMSDEQAQRAAAA